jgi:hypothetical protein
MSVVAAAPRLVRPEPKFNPTALPSLPFLALEKLSMRELDNIFMRGTTPDVDSLIGWEFRGLNHLVFMLPITRPLGIKKFVKGFVRDEDGRVMGYNSPVRNNALDGRWNVAHKRFGFYEVEPVDPTSRDNKYLHALMLDYSKGNNPITDPSAVLRDYLVQVDPGNPDLFIGKAYMAFGPLRLRSNFFFLERFRVGLTDYVKR